MCGSDLWPYRGAEPIGDPHPMGHEYVGFVEEVGAEVTSVRPGQFVVGSFATSDNTCANCRNGFPSNCSHREFMSTCQADYVRIPNAQGTLVATDGIPDERLWPGLLAVSDVMGTGWWAADAAEVKPGSTAVVVGDGAVGLCAVIAARRLGAERIVLAGRHEARTDLGRYFGATDVVAERGEEGIARIRELAGNVDKVIEAVGTRPALDTALGAVRDGGTISRLGVPQYEQGPIGPAEFMRNITLTGGASPARAYIEELLPDVLDGTTAPGRVFDQTSTLDQTPQAYRAMADRQVLKALIRP